MSVRAREPWYSLRRGTDPVALYVGAMAYWHFGPTPCAPPSYCTPPALAR